MSASRFQRFLPFSNLVMLAPLDLWLSRLWGARFRVGLIYVPRLIVTLAVSAINTLLTLPERLLAPLLVSGKRVPAPVFVIGAHRSGTTHLHYLLSLDPQFVSPRTYQVMNPLGFLSTGWLLVPLIAVFFPWRRPMDQMSWSMFSPNEEEFAIAHSSPLSPHWGTTFPRQGAEYDRFAFADRMSPGERERWKGKLLLFLRKLCLFGDRRPLLKNPYNTGRVALLRELFPEARFVHIYRNPFAVHRSCAKLERDGHSLVQLQDAPPGAGYADRYLENYAAVEESFYREAAAAPAGSVSELRFEDLEADPLGQIERIYRELGLSFSQEHRRRLEQYLRTIAGYRKNTFQPLPGEQAAAVAARLAPLFDRWGYDPSPR